MKTEASGGSYADQGKVAGSERPPTPGGSLGVSKGENTSSPGLGLTPQRNVMGGMDRAPQTTSRYLARPDQGTQTPSDTTAKTGEKKDSGGDTAPGQTSSVKVEGPGDRPAEKAGVTSTDKSAERSTRKVEAPDTRDDAGRDDTTTGQIDRTMREDRSTAKVGEQADESDDSGASEQTQGRNPRKVSGKDYTDEAALAMDDVDRASDIQTWEDVEDDWDKSLEDEYEKIAFSGDSDHESAGSKSTASDLPLEDEYVDRDGEWGMSPEDELEFYKDLDQLPDEIEGWGEQEDLKDIFEEADFDDEGNIHVKDAVTQFLDDANKYPRLSSGQRGSLFRLIGADTIPQIREDEVFLDGLPEENRAGFLAILDDSQSVPEVIRRANEESLFSSDPEERKAQVKVLQGYTQVKTPLERVFADDEFKTSITSDPGQSEAYAELFGDSRSVQDVLELSNLRLVHWTAKHSNSALPLADRLTAGYEGLHKAVQKYDVTRGEFSTYAPWWIRSAIQRASYRETSNIYAPEHVVMRSGNPITTESYDSWDGETESITGRRQEMDRGKYMGDKKVDVEATATNAVMDEAKRKALAAAMEGLSPRQRAVMQGYLQDLDRAEIAGELGIEADSVSKYRTHAIHKLRGDTALGDAYYGRKPKDGVSKGDRQAGTPREATIGTSKKDKVDPRRKGTQSAAELQTAAAQRQEQAVDMIANTDMTYEEIAEKLGGISVGTVKNYAYRHRQATEAAGSSAAKPEPTYDFSDTHGMTGRLKENDTVDGLTVKARLERISGFSDLGDLSVDELAEREKIPVDVAATYKEVLRPDALKKAERAGGKLSHEQTLTRRQQGMLLHELGIDTRAISGIQGISEGLVRKDRSIYLAERQKAAAQGNPEGTTVYSRPGGSPAEKYVDQTVPVRR